MDARIRRFALALFVLCFAFSATLPAYPAAPQWVEIRSPHFSVVTDAGEKHGREVALRFEQMRTVFGALMTKANVNIPVPLQIVAFRNTKELRQFAPLWNGKPTQVAGLFQSSEDRNFIMLDVSAENPWTVVFHEYAHQLMNGILSERLDPWFEEGFAEYFSSIEVDGKEARVGKVPEYEYQVLQHEGILKITDLFKVRQNSETYNESGERRSVFYAESGIFVHYLYDHQLIPKLTTYFELEINHNVPVEQAIQQTFGMTPTKLDKELRDYVSSGGYRYYPISTSKIVSNDYTATVLSTADAEAVLADIHLHSPDYQDKALEEFEAILKIDPNSAAACRGLGYAYLRKRDFKQAREYFHRAAQADSKDPRVHYYSALLMSQEGLLADRSELPEMARELETSITLDPSFADSYMLLGLTQMSQGDTAKALQAMLKAVQLSPRNEQYQYNLAQMYANNRQLDQALLLLRGLQKTQNQQLALRVSESLAQVLQMKEMLRSDSHSENSAVPATPLAPDHAEDPQAQDREAAKAEAHVGNPPPIRFLKGIVAGVDCSSPPVAILTVVSGASTWKMKVSDSNHVILIGADKFSCSWSKQKVALNYNESGHDEGSVVSLEVQ